MRCSLCLENNKLINKHDIFEQINIDLDMASIIGKHFWFKPYQDGNSTRFICENCWTATKQFHDFYVQIQIAHKYFNNKNDSFKIEEVAREGKLKEQSIKDENLITPQTDEINSNNLNTCKNINYEINGIKIEEVAREGKLKEQSIKDENLIKPQTDEINSNNLNTCKNINYEINGTAKTRKMKKQNSNFSLNKRKDLKTYKTKTKSLSAENKELSTTKLYEEDKMICQFLEIICCICSEKSLTFTSLKRHFSSEHKEDGYLVCCSKKFYKRNSLVDHIGKHINPNSFRCDKCEKTFKTRRTLKNHVKKVHQCPPIQRCECSHCGNTFKNEKTLSRHMLTHIPIEERKFKCTLCVKAYSTQGLLDQHNRFIHDKMYSGICDICGKTFNNKQDVKRHRISVHKTGEKLQIKCKHCEVEFSTKYQYNRHREQIHNSSNKKVERECFDCNKVYGNSAALRKHNYQVHKKKPTFMCTICKNLFKTELSLKEHMATHTGEHLYACPYCSKTFTHSANMHHHRKQAHPIEFEAARISKRDKTQTWVELTSLRS